MWKPTWWSLTFVVLKYWIQDAFCNQMHLYQTMLNVQRTHINTLAGLHRSEHKRGQPYSPMHYYCFFLFGYKNKFNENGMVQQAHYRQPYTLHKLIVAKMEQNVLNHNERLAVRLSSYIMEMWKFCASQMPTASYMLNAINQVRKYEVYQKQPIYFGIRESNTFFSKVAVVNWKNWCLLPVCSVRCMNEIYVHDFFYLCERWNLNSFSNGKSAGAAAAAMNKYLHLF